MANTQKSFKGIKQVLEATYTATTSKAGYIWFVRKDATSKDGDIYFGSRHYGHFGNGELTALETKLQALIDAKVAKSDYDTKIGEIETSLGLKANAADIITYKADGASIEQATSGKNVTFSVKAVAQNKVTGLADTLAGKVNVETGKGLSTNDYTTAEKGKLAGIEEDAQVNVIESVKVNGVALAVDGKAVNVVVPAATVVGIAEGEKVLSLADKKLSTSLELKWDKGNKKIQLLGKASGDTKALVSEIDAADFVKDGMLKNVELKEVESGETAGTYLRFTWNTDGGDQTLDVNVTSLIDVYTAGNGVAINGKVVSAKVNKDDKYITVDANGIASKGIDDAITKAVADKNVSATGDTYVDATASGNKVTVVATDALKTAVTNANSALQSISAKGDAYVSASADTKSNVTVSTKIQAISGASADAKGLAEASDVKAALDKKVDAVEDSRLMTNTEGTKLANIAAGAQVNVIEGIEGSGAISVSTVASKKQTVSLKIDTGATKGNVTLTQSANGLTANVTIPAAEVSSIASSGKTINVTHSGAAWNVDVNKVAAPAEGEGALGSENIFLQANANGALYGVMYYDGDDVE